MASARTVWVSGCAVCILCVTFHGNAIGRICGRGRLSSYYFHRTPLVNLMMLAGADDWMVVQIYLSGYLFTITYAKNSQAPGIITIIRLSLHLVCFHQLIPLLDFTVSVIAPVASVVSF